MATSARTASFGPYTLDLRSGELRKFGVRVKMGEQPLQILLMLLESPGEMVSREELRAKLWTDDTFVDFDHGLNSAVQRLRDCLSDTAEKPLWVETIPRRGYRFVGKIEWSNGVRPPETAPDGDTAAATYDASPKPNGTTTTQTARRKKITLVAALAASVAALAAAALGIYWLQNARRPAPFATFTITKVTNNGKTIATAISPDGKYLLSVRDEDGKQSMWLRHLQTNSEAQVIAPAVAFYQSLVFSPDGSYFYFLKAFDAAHTSYNILRAPVLGGEPRIVARDLDIGTAVSPDGARIAYVRGNNPAVGRFQLLVANADGSDEKILSGGTFDKYPGSLSWSPDGRQIVSIPPGPGDSVSAIQLQNSSSAAVEALAPLGRTQLYNVAWLPDSRGLLVLYSPTPPFDHIQIGLLANPAAPLRAITNDTDTYRALSVSADGKTIATVQERSTRTLYLLPRTGFSGLPPNPAAAQHKASLFSWASNGDLYFFGGSDLLRRSPNGADTTTVLSDPAAVVFGLSACPDGRHILVSWAGRGGTNKIYIWRVNADGSNPTQLTRGGMDGFPLCSPDSKWAYYQDIANFQVMRAPIDGGSPEVVPGSRIPGELDDAVYDLAISPNGKSLAFAVNPPRGADSDGSMTKIELLTLDAGPNPPARLVSADSHISSHPAFTLNGKALVYTVRDNGVDNLLLQPLDGLPSRLITNFTSDKIQNFEFSPDGKTLAVFQQHLESDAVLLHDTK